MPLVNSAELERLLNQGENKLSDEIPFLVDRTSLTVVAGTQDYTLPDYVRIISRVTWKGLKLYPLPSRLKREVFQLATSSGRPYYYTVDSIGLNKISLYPIPSENVASVTNVWSTDIANGVIVEFSRVSDNSTFVVPSYFKRQLLKYYLASRQYQQEGLRGKFNVAQYYKQRWDMESKQFESFIEENFTRAVRTTAGMLSPDRRVLAPPVLPIRYQGTSE